ncbi:MAG: glycoside hydrolase family 5 protein [Thermoguttaceae bacterium]
MKSRLNWILFLVVFVLLLPVVPAGARDRWSAEEANAWYARQPWMVGCNFSPSTAINQLEMWQADTFDPETIDRELGWAEKIGFTSVRVFLHNLLWEQDREGFLVRLDQFLAIADKHGIGVMLVPLDGVWDPQPRLGKQHDPRPHVHNSGWVQAPGAEILRDPARPDRLKPYIVGLVEHFRNDRRVQAWDLFNEADNPNRNSYGVDGFKTELPEDLKVETATRLLAKLFVWAREADATQPLTAGLWRDDWSSDDKLSPFNKLMVDESDVISFHCYGPPQDMRDRVTQLRRFGRPLLCTEYMSRGSGSTFNPIMGYLKEQNVAAYNWGLVDGKTQTAYPWETWQKQYTSKPDVWFHEIFHADGRPFDALESEYIKSVTQRP